MACNNQDLQHDIEPIQQSNSVAELSLEDVPGMLEALAPYVNPALVDRGNISSSNQGDTYFGMSIDFDRILAKVD